MNMSTSECSSGCESGWTMYLDQYSNSAEKEKSILSKYHKEAYHQEEDDEDLSMVSDASSGPPQYFHENEGFCFKESEYLVYPPSSAFQQRKGDQKKKNKEDSRSRRHSLFLDDTASSPDMRFAPQDNINVAPSGNQTSLEHKSGYSQDISVAHAPKQGKSGQRKFGFFRSSVKGKTTAGK